MGKNPILILIILGNAPMAEITGMAKRPKHTILAVLKLRISSLSPQEKRLTAASQLSLTKV